MKKFLTLLLGLFFAATTLTAAAAETKNKEVTFYVNVHCHTCLKRIDKNVPFIKGVINYKASLENKSLKITYNPDKTNEETLKKEIEKANFIVAKTAEELKKLTNE
ncbi:MAG: heavy-metal-associated domain-containing protein [Bacteroidales bacterium]|jgi:copper chaperone CopZ|nr:heavy-metal-associated domain-containing protein [Bacteroidales bacterium]